MENKSYQNYLFTYIEICFMYSFLIKTLDLAISKF